MGYANISEIEQALLAALGDEAAAKQLAQQARPGVWLQTGRVEREAQIALGSTKLGGCPDLPVGASWPLRPAYPDAASRGQYPRASERPFQTRLHSEFPLNFLAQINFAQLHAAADLGEDWPRQGLLSIFYDLTEQPWGHSPADAVGLKLFYSDEAAGPLQRLPQPEALQALPAHWHMAPLQCSLHACVTPLPVAAAEWKQQAQRLERDVQDSYADWCEAEAEPAVNGESWACHHAGGWPTPIQGDMQTQCALVAAGLDSGKGEHWCDPATQVVRDGARDWLLLLQIGSDEKSTINWGDEGQLYLWIRREDLRARRFDQAQLVLQCY